MKSYVSFITVGACFFIIFLAGCIKVEVPAEPQDEYELKKELFTQSWVIVSSQFNGVSDSTLPWSKTRNVRFYADGTFSVSFLNNVSYEEGTWRMEDSGKKVTLRWTRYTTSGYKETQTWDLLDITRYTLEMRRMDPFGSNPRTTLYLFQAASIH